MYLHSVCSRAYYSMKISDRRRTNRHRQTKGNNTACKDGLQEHKLFTYFNVFMRYMLADIKTNLSGRRIVDSACIRYCWNLSIKRASFIYLIFYYINLWIYINHLFVKHCFGWANPQLYISIICFICQQINCSWGPWNARTHFEFL